MGKQTLLQAADRAEPRIGAEAARSIAVIGEDLGQRVRPVVEVAPVAQQVAVMLRQEDPATIPGWHPIAAQRDIDDILAETLTLLGTGDGDG